MDDTLFFIQTPPGLENLAIDELKEKWPLLWSSPLPNIEYYTGGFEILLKQNEGFYLNHVLKIPNRILIRELSFKCRDLPKLFNRVKKQRWGRYFSRKMPTLHITCHKSRLHHSGKIEATIKSAIEESFRAHEPREKMRKKVASFNDFHLFIRFYEDTCTISVDTSGKRLGMRGHRPHHSLAPIRENLAAALFFALSPHLASKTTILDPMCGSGTLLIEAATFYRISHRQCSYEFFSFHKEEVNLPQELKEQNFLIEGHDRDEKQLQSFKKSLELGKVEAGIRLKDVFDETPSAPIKNLIILTNPPYGRRINIDQKYYFKRLKESLIRQFHPDHLFFIVPKNIFNEKGILEFQNGGIPVKLCHFSKQ